MPQRSAPFTRCARLAVLALGACLLGSAAAPAVTHESAREAALEFGQALTAGDASAMRPLLPEEGKVQLRLERLGPEQGYFSSAQVEALLRDFLAHGSVRAFELLRVEYEETIALVHARAALTDRMGRPARIKLHLALRPEGDHWVLREIREVAS